MLKRSTLFVVLLLAVAMRALERVEQVPLRTLRRDAAPVFLEESFVRLALEVSVRARELAGHHQAGLDDVVHELDEGAALRMRPERQVFLGNVPDFCDHSLAREGPRLEGFLQEGRVFVHRLTPEMRAREGARIQRRRP